VRMTPEGWKTENDGVGKVESRTASNICPIAAYPLNW
jgi:hypothetical protein